MIKFGRKFILSPLLLCGALALAAPSIAISSDPGHDTENASGDAGHVSHGINWIDFSGETSPLAAVFFNFIVTVIAVYFIMRKGIAAKLITRKEVIETALAEAKLLKDRAEAAMAEAVAKSEALDQEMAKIRKDILESGQSQSARIIEEAEARAERMREDAQGLVAQEVARMVDQIRTEIVEEVIQLAQQKILEETSEEDNDRLTKGYIDFMTPATSFAPKPTSSNGKV